MALMCPFLHKKKKIVKIIFYDHVGIKTNIIQAGIYSFAVRLALVVNDGILGLRSGPQKLDK